MITNPDKDNVWWLTTCDRLCFEYSFTGENIWSGYEDIHRMVDISPEATKQLIMSGLLISMFVENVEELNLQVALGTFCDMLGIDGTPIELIPSVTLYAQFDPVDDYYAYARTNCVQRSYIEKE